MLRVKLTSALIGVFCVVVAFAACSRDVTTVVQEEAAASSCFECHSDVDTRLVAIEKQWQNSRHASGLNTDRNTPTCSGCHTSEGFKDRVADIGPGTYPNATVIHCFTCHAPHSTSDFSLRVNDPQMLANGVSRDIRLGNICVVCHVARQNVDTYVDIGTVTFTSPFWGPHYGTQGDMIFGSNGYEFDDYDYLDTAGHRNATRDGCLDCHLRVTRNFVVGGHSFNMRALLPTEFGTGEAEEFEEILNTAACTPCHGQMNDFNYRGVQDEIDSLADSLETILITAGLIDDTGHTIRGVTTSADSAGAVWNWLLVHEDRSRGVHNAEYMRGLLESSIQYMQPAGPQPSSQASAPFAAREQDPTTLNP